MTPIHIRIHDKSLTGISENSIFNEIKSFHITDNFYFDMMHDLFEGVCGYNMCKIIKYCIAKDYFTLEILNSRKKLFDYGITEIGNISPQITELHLKKGNIKMSAREMMNFVHFFPLTIADLIPNTDRVWIFFTLFLKIIDVCMISKYCVELIEQHHRMYMEIFQENLKPKHHFMVHYPSAILNSGPLKHVWSFRFEAKHKNFKNYCRNITSRKNLPFTLSIKAGLQFANSIFKKEYNSMS